MFKRWEKKLVGETVSVGCDAKQLVWVVVLNS